MVLPNISPGSIGQADVVAVGLGHLAHAIGALEQRHGKRDLRLHTHLLHELATSEQVEELVGAAHLHVGLDLHGVEGLHHGIQELMQGDRRLRLVALGKVIALKDAGDGELGAHLQQAGQRSIERIQSPLCTMVVFSGSGIFMAWLT